MRAKSKFILGVLVAGLAAQHANATPIEYSSRSTFLGALGTNITDNYEESGFIPGQTDAQMSSVLGETRYQSTGFPNVDVVFPFGGGNNIYCAGCNGSFNLYFTSTSLGTASGVFGVGLDVIFNAANLYTAFVTFGDGSTEDFAVPTGFFGITSDQFVQSIAFGPGNGGTSQSGNFGIDNLTIGAAPSAVPEADSIGYFGVAFLALMGWGMTRRREVLNRL